MLNKKGFFIVACLALTGFGASASDMSPEAIQRRTQPIGQVYIMGDKPVVATPALTTPVVSEADRGRKVYETACVICHASGAAGAPKLGDRQAWAPRVKQGMAVLLAHVNDGFNFMPPKGTCVQCSNEDLKAAIQYMISSSSLPVPK
jgi:cytochrome c5